MTNVIQNVYPKDLTMTLASNHVEREKKVFLTAADRIFVPDGGPFFSQSLVIKDNNGALLKPQVDYQLLYLSEEATIESGRDVVAVINVLKSTITYVMLDYRVVGGGYGNTVNAIMQEITKAGPIQKNVDWNIHVYDKPVQFPPAPHYVTPDAFTSWKMVYTQLEGIRKAILVGDDPSWESHYSYVNRVAFTVTENINSNLNNYATKQYVTSVVNGIDMTVDLSGYYTKSQIDTSLLAITRNVTTVTSNLNTNYYTKTETDSRYPLKNDVYTKLQSDARYAYKTDNYTKSESDGKYALKTSLSSYATDTELAQAEARLKVLISNSNSTVDLSDYYTKTQTYAKTEVYNKGETYSRAQTYSKSEVDSRIKVATDGITNLTNQLNTFVPTYRIVNKSSNYTLAAADLKGDTIIRCVSGSATTITLPSIWSDMVTGTTVTIRQVGAGIVTIAAASGVTISPNDSLKLRRSGITATFVYVGSNNFDLITELG